VAVVVAQSGTIYICTAGGSPGTWTPVSDSSGYTTVQGNGSGITARSIINFINGTFTTATAVDNTTKSDVKFDVSVAAPTAETTFGAGSAAGSATTLARSDHTHGNPTHDGAAHSAISISSLAVPTADVAWNSKKITGLLDPTAAQDAATKAYVDSIASGLDDFKNSVRVATTANGTIATAFANTQVVDGVTLATGDRILLKNQTTASENGIYTVNAAGAPTRATDMDANGELSVGTLVYVESGTVNGGQQWICNATGATPWVPGSSTSTWAMFFAVTSTQAGAGLTASGNVLAVGQNANNTIVVNADDITVNRTGTSGSHVAVLFTTATHASTTSIAITHNLGNQWVVAQVFDVATGAMVECDVTLTSSTVTTFAFATAPGANSLRFVIWG
jgi:hypothetical protein